MTTSEDFSKWEDELFDSNPEYFCYSILDMVHDMLGGIDPEGIAKVFEAMGHGDLVATARRNVGDLTIDQLTVGAIGLGQIPTIYFASPDDGQAGAELVSLAVRSGNARRNQREAPQPSATGLRERSPEARRAPAAP